MKSGLLPILTIVLTGEWLADLLANNAGVIVLIIGALLLWYLTSRGTPPNGDSGQAQSLKLT
jgi:hypothetical protein